MRGRSKFLDYEPVTRRPASQGPKDRDLTKGESRPLDSSLGSVLTTQTTLPVERTGDLGKETATPGKPRLGSFRESWILRRGHSASFAGLFFFTTVLYFRPYEFAALSWLSTSAYWIALATLTVYFPTQLGLEGNLTARPREVKLLLWLLLCALLSIPLAINPGEAWETFTDSFIKVVLMFLVMVNVVRTKLRLNALIFLAMAVSLMLSLNAINDYRLGRLELRGARIAGSIGGMFENPNDLAMHLVLIAPLVFAFVLSTRSFVLRILYGSLGTLMLMAVIVTFSRGGFLALIAGSGIFIFKVSRKNRVVALIVMGVALMTFLAFAPGGYADRIGSIFKTGSDITGSSGAREQLLTRSTHVTLRHPLLGVGMGNFHYHSIQEQVTHNSYTQVGSEMGIVAMIIYTMFIIAPYRKLQRIEIETANKNDQKWAHYLAIGLQSGLVAYLVVSFFGSIAYLWYLYYLVGYSVCLRRVYTSLANATPGVARLSL